jgi:hypothetical protein
MHELRLDVGLFIAENDANSEGGCALPAKMKVEYVSMKVEHVKMKVE